jgi:hypothetical protein
VRAVVHPNGQRAGFQRLSNSRLSQMQAYRAEPCLKGKADLDYLSRKIQQDLPLRSAGLLRLWLSARDQENDSKLATAIQPSSGV